MGIWKFIESCLGPGTLIFTFGLCFVIMLILIHCACEAKKVFLWVVSVAIVLGLWALWLAMANATQITAAQADSTARDFFDLPRRPIDQIHKTYRLADSLTGESVKLK